MASSHKSYADILKNARKPPPPPPPPPPAPPPPQPPPPPQQKQAPPVKKNKANSNKIAALGPKPSFPPPNSWTGRSWASVLKGVNKGSPSIVQNTASPPLSVVATPKPVPQKATKTATPTKKQQEQPPAPANMLTTTTPARILLNTPQNKTKINTKTRTQTQTHNKETLATGCPPCPSPPPPESPAGLSSPVSRPWTPSSNQSQTQTASSAQHAPFAHLWSNPQGADVQIECQGLAWLVHRHVLVPASEWIEKYIPPQPQAADSSNKPVIWKLSHWNPGILSAVLRYTYLEEYPGGDYSPKDPLNTKPVITAVAHFLAGTACLHRPLMDHALRQIEHASREIKTTLTPQLLQHHHHHHRRWPLNDKEPDLNDFSYGLRIAMAMTYDEPDQWRIRALRVVMGKLMAVAFPLLLRNPRWGTKYCAEWGPLRPRVVADHIWLTEVGVQQEQEQGGETVTRIERNESMLAGYEDMDLLWEVYRREGWQPTDDLMFPERGGDDPADLRPVPPPVFDSTKSDINTTTINNNGVDARGRPRNRSRAIPIMRPDGTSITLPRPNEGSPIRSNSRLQGKLDGMLPPGKSISSSRAQSWPRGPQLGFAAAAAPPSTAPKPFAKKDVLGSPLKKCSTLRTSTQSAETAVPVGGADDIDTRPDDTADDVSLASMPQMATEQGGTEPKRSTSREAGDQHDTS